MDAKKLVREKVISSAWARDMSVFIKQTRESDAIEIFSQNDLYELSGRTFLNQQHQQIPQENNEQAAYTQIEPQSSSNGSSN